MNENDIQRAVFKHLRTRGAAGIVAFHPKNGGLHQRGLRRGINAGLGVLSGIPDVIVFKPGNVAWLTEVYALELKTSAGKASETQRAVLQTLKAAGVKVAVTYGLDEALKQIEAWGLVKGRVA